MKSSKKILILPGDGVGPEVCKEALKVMNSLSNLPFELDFERNFGSALAKYFKDNDVK